MIDLVPLVAFASGVVAGLIVALAFRWSRKPRNDDPDYGAAI